MVCKSFLILVLSFNSFFVTAQVRIRLFSDYKPEHVIFFVTGGEYELNLPDSENIKLGEGSPLMISKSEDRLAVKLRNMPGFYADSLAFTSISDSSSFSLSLNGEDQRRTYSGDLEIIPDLGTLVLTNNCNTEDYIAGVVQSEGGNGKYAEFFRTQAIIARTYMHRNMHRHGLDGYDLCDDTHCQVYAGTITNSTIISAVKSTARLVILDNESRLINPAFHSNCGGETSPAEFVWLSSAPYLKRIKDPYCQGRPNFKWQKTITAQQWIDMVRNTDHEGRTINIRDAAFIQSSRSEMYRAGKVTVPFREIRDALDLRSAYFSVSVEGNKVILKGKGYGHGIGLCQEGAMVMAGKGNDYRKIIDFYYPGVKVEDISIAVPPEEILK